VRKIYPAVIQKRGAPHNRPDSNRHRMKSQWQVSQIVGCFPAGQDETKRASLIVTAGMDFARKAAAASIKAFLPSSPFASAACE